MHEGVAGTAWEVHGGGFYHVEKFVIAPKDLPPDLLWYKWEAYLTWVTGFALLILQYYWNANAYLIDRSVLPLLPVQAIVLSVGGLIVGWFIYDYLCKSRIGRNTALLALAVFVLILAATWFFSHVFSGRGALIHVGAFVGTLMAVNVFGVIIPNQKKITASLIVGEPPDPQLGAVGKQRSVHNNYLTLPVLVMMVSAHYPMLTSHPHTWMVVAMIVIMGAAVRHFINRHDAGDPLAKIAWALPVAAVALAVAMYLTAPASRSTFAGVATSDEVAFRIIGSHCVMCHTEYPSHEGYEAPPKGVVLGTLVDVKLYRDQILDQAVYGNAMPLGNENGMTRAERDELGAWLLGQ
jgi:uncharacterized membrane protein